MTSFEIFEVIDITSWVNWVRLAIFVNIVLGVVAYIRAHIIDRSRQNVVKNFRKHTSHFDTIVGAVVGSFWTVFAVMLVSCMAGSLMYLASIEEWGDYRRRIRHAQ